MEIENAFIKTGKMLPVFLMGWKKYGRITKKWGFHEKNMKKKSNISCVCKPLHVIIQTVALDDLATAERLTL